MTRFISLKKAMQNSFSQAHLKENKKLNGEYIPFSPLGQIKKYLSIYCKILPFHIYIYRERDR